MFWRSPLEIFWRFSLIIRFICSALMLKYFDKFFMWSFEDLVFGFLVVYIIKCAKKVDDSHVIVLINSCIKQKQNIVNKFVCFRALIQIFRLLNQTLFIFYLIGKFSDFFASYTFQSQYAFLIFVDYSLEYFGF